MRVFTPAALAAALLAGPVQAELTPIAATGYTHDFILNGDAPYDTAVTGTMDGGLDQFENWTWVEAGEYTNPAGDLQTYLGLTAGVQNSLTGTGTFMLQDFNANNVVALDGGASGTLTLDTPAAYEAIALYGASGFGAKTADVLLTFDDASTAMFTVASGTGIGTDWFNTSPDKALVVGGRSANKSEEGYTRLFYGEDDRIGINESLFVLDAADQAKLLASVTITNTGGNRMAVFAISGGTLPVPEPAAAGLLALGAASLAGRRRSV